MGVFPSSRIGKVEFYETHIAPWTTNAVAIGLVATDVTALAAATSAARLSYNAMLSARSEAEAATQAFYADVRAMHNAPGAGSDMVETIKNFAKSTNDPNVYTLAQIPPPAQPGSAPPPGTPFDFRVTLKQDGSVEMRWKCSNPPGAPGTMYEVMRSENGGPMAFFQNVGERRFTDSTLPANSGPVTYRVTAVRSTLRGDPAQFTVRFGAGGASLESGSGGLSLAA